MTPDPPSTGRFHTTQWTLMDRVRQGQSLTSFLDRYQRPLKYHLQRKWRLNPDDAQDVWQGFVADKILEKQLVSSADKSRGRFRNFILTALNHYVTDLSRRGVPPFRKGSAPVPLEDSPEQVDSEPLPPDEFLANWGRTVIAEALSMMQLDCKNTGREDLWHLLQERILAPALGGAPSSSYQQIVERFGYKSPSQAHNALVTAKRRFRACLEAVVKEYAEDDSAIGEEIAQLKEVLARSSA